MILLSSALAAGTTDPVELGRDLFVRTWMPGDPRSLGDGLGPLFNEFSCVACHSQGGVGGAGGPHADVRLQVSADGGVTVLHRYGRLGQPGVDARRNTPALFGAGLIDAIPEATIAAGSRQAPEGFPKISGEVPRVGKQVGRFGWKGDVATLEDFVLQACAVELGLRTIRDFEPGGPPPDLSLAEVGALTAYVAALPAPVRDPVPGAAHGAEVFRSVGCAACHVERLGDVEGLYSDLLLHDLGGRLADPVGGYYGARHDELVAVAGEWRTPPLWGLRDSAPYLHDGRAATVREAITWHDGEAREVVDRYLAVSEADATALEAFLLSLAAPR